MPIIRLAAPLAAVAAFVLAVLLSPTTASALVLLPHFEAEPASAELGTAFNLYVAWAEPGGVTVAGCANSVDYEVYGPGSNPFEGEFGPEIASSVIPASTYSTEGSVLSYGTSRVTPTQTGIYTIIPAQGSYCEGAGILPGHFEVTSHALPAASLALAPISQSRSIDESATVTATLRDGESGQPLSGVALTFAIAGPNSALTGTCEPADCVTDSSGQVSWSYAANATGHDTIDVQASAQGQSEATAQASVDWTPTLNGAPVAVLGDSYSAGDGDGSYLTGTHTPGVNTCYRSSLAYGPLLDSQFDMGSLGFAACSGAVTDDLFKSNHAINETPDGDIEPAQLCHMAAVGEVAACGSSRLPVVGSDTKTVMLTIGGNDAGFSAVVSSCIWASLGPFNWGMPGRNCSRKPSVYGPAYRRLAALNGFRSEESPDGTPIHSLLETLMAVHATVPDAHVYIAGYPRLFQDRSRRDCTVGTLSTASGIVQLRITPTDAAWLDSAATMLNAEISRAATAAGRWATYVGVQERFAGHGICTRSPWLYPVRATASLAFDQPHFISLTVQTGALHPTAAGQSAGYEQAFLAAGAAG